MTNIYLERCWLTKRARCAAISLGHDISKKETKLIFPLLLNHARQLSWKWHVWYKHDFIDKIKEKIFFKFCESFLRNSLVCTLTDLNPRFGGPWDNMLLIFLGYGTFIMLQKSFGQNYFWISCSGSKLEGALSFYGIHNCKKAVCIVKLFLSSIQNGFYRLWIENQNM